MVHQHHHERREWTDLSFSSFHSSSHSLHSLVVFSFAFIISLQWRRQILDCISSDNQRSACNWIFHFPFLFPLFIPLTPFLIASLCVPIFLFLLPLLEALNTNKNLCRSGRQQTTMTALCRHTHIILIVLFVLLFTTEFRRRYTTTKSLLCLRKFFYN